MAEVNVTQQISLKELQARYDAEEAALATTQVQAPLPAPGYNGVSTMAQASEEAMPAVARYAPKLRPTLPSPKSYQLMLVEMHRDVESVVTTGASLSHEWLKTDGERQQELMKKNFDALQKEAEIAASQKNWSTLTSIAQYVSYFALLMSAPATGGLVGAAWYAATALQAAAAFGLIQKVGQDTGVTQMILDFVTNSKETQSRIETHLNYLGVAAGLATFILAWQTNVFAAPRNPEALDWIRNIAAFGSAAGAVSQLGLQWNQRKRTNIQADILERDVARKFITKETEQNMNHVQQSTKLLEAATQMTKTSLANAELEPLEA